MSEYMVMTDNEAGVGAAAITIVFYLALLVVGAAGAVVLWICGELGAMAAQAIWLFAIAVIGIAGVIWAFACRGSKYQKWEIIFWPCLVLSGLSSGIVLVSLTFWLVQHVRWV